MGARQRSVVASATATLLFLSGTAAAGAMPADDPSEVFENAAPGTVSVIGEGDVALGSGFVYDSEEGRVLTNAHVIEGQAALKVRIGEKEPVPVRVLGSDPCEDLAVVEFTSPQENLKELEFGDSDKVEAADTVTAIGYPASFENPAAQKPVFTSGSVQSPDVAAEPDPSLPRYPSTIQHSATVNPGNSGGPLLDSEGKVVGINSLVNPEAQGQYYAISANHARPLLDGLAEGDKKNDPGWAISAVEDPFLSEYFSDPEDQKIISGAQERLIKEKVTGLFIRETATNSPAYEAGLGLGDVITHVKDAPVASVGDLCDVLQSSAPGEKIPIDGILTVNAEVEEATFGDPWTTELELPAKP
ncbi:S1C family serine protease [Streptomyces sp. NPDC047928]|uniref:S1C family serine protease n=1 Tax=unclassified Streptomyces TaxID=2593676 RepID=UPI0037187DE2